MKSGMLSLRLMVLITDTEAYKKIHRLFSEERIPVYHQCRGQGTAKTELLDICGLSGSARLITAAIIPKVMTGRMFQRLEEVLQIWRKGRGIAVTIPITGLQECIRKLVDQELCEKWKKMEEGEELQMKKEASFSMVLVTVKEGYSDEVIDAATKAGAGGGSVIRGRRRGSEALVQFLGISLQEEQEILMIVVPKEKKREIMSAVNARSGISTEARGMIISVPVEDMIGFETR